MPVQLKKLHPALKHAGYASTSVLPGEDKPAFEKLNRDLIAEFSPNGALENDIVTTMAHLLWRKKNLATFRIAELAQDRCRQIRDEKYTWIEEDPPVLLGIRFKPVDPVVRDAAIRAAEDQARKELGEIYELEEIGETATVDHLMKDLEVQERLDAMIDKCVKRLLMVRGVKSMSLPSTSAAPQRLPGRRPEAA
jgi:hypothetical protein